jgi:protein gp37
MNGRMLPAWGTGLKYSVPNREKVEIFLDEKELMKPLKWLRPRKIFPCSMTDWMADFVTFAVEGHSAYIQRKILEVAVSSPKHEFQFLTKRAKECAEWVPALMNRIYGFNWRPSSNIMIGFSAENQEYFDTRWAHMRHLAAKGWRVWVSLEPLLGGVDLGSSLPEGLSWCVVGGESGPGARPFDLQWARSIIRQCKAAGVPCFFKQAGAHVVSDMCGPAWAPPRTESCKLPDGRYGQRIRLADRKGGDLGELPYDLRVREMPEVRQ